MIQNPDFYQTIISNKKMIFPSGMAIVNRVPVMTIEGSMEIIWDLFAEDSTIDSVISKMIERFQPETIHEVARIRDDTINVCQLLEKYQAIIDVNELNKKRESNIIIQNDEITIKKIQDEYIIDFIDNGKTYSTRFYTDPSKNNYDLNKIAQLQYEEKVPYRFGFSYNELMNNRIFIHSSSVLYEDKLWVFAGHSGDGKTTHTDMWDKEKIGKVINGDLNLVGIEEKSGYKKVIAYGTPWCGTSERFSLEKYPIGGIILVAKASGNYVEDFSYEKKMLGLLSKSISPRWNAEMVKKNLEITKQIIDNTMICRLNCTTNHSALTVMKEYIDCYLDQK